MSSNNDTTANDEIVTMACRECDEQSEYPVSAFGADDDRPEIGDTANAHNCDSCGNDTHLVIAVGNAELRSDGGRLSDGV